MTKDEGNAADGRFSAALRFSQKFGCLLREGHVDIDPRAHLKSGRGGQPRDNLKVPMVVILSFILNGRRMDDVVIIRIIELDIEFMQGGPEDLSKYLGVLHRDLTE